MVLWLLLLVFYLWWPGLQERLGRFYLPVGLTIATLAPLMERALTLNYLTSIELPVDTQYAVIGTGWQLVLALFLPLTLIAWQYRYREVFFYVAATTAIELVLTWLVWRPESLESWIVIGVTFSRAIIYLIVGYVITRMIGAQREQRQKLADANARLSHYAATVEQLAVSHERNRLARELHDTLAHTLSSLSVQLEAVESVWRKAPDQAHELLVKARANARSGLTETRRALQALRASPLEDLGLVLAVDNLATATAARNGLAMRIDLCDDIDGLSPAAEQAIYRTAQEALANVVKHSGTRSVIVTLIQKDGAVVLQIEDFGQGFDVSEQLASEVDEDDEHYGLRGLHERAGMINGELTVVSIPGEGTTVRLEVPVG